MSTHNIFYEGMAQDLESELELDFNSDEELDDAISIMSDGLSDESYEVIRGSVDNENIEDSYYESSTNKSSKHPTYAEITLYGKKFNLSVKYHHFNTEKILPIQYEALDAFLEIDLSNSMSALKKYCSNDKININSSNVFKYVNPTCIFIERTNNARTVGILCDYTVDEHGIAIVYKNEKFIEVVSQDEFL